jgi:hypothetical protein
VTALGTIVGAEAAAGLGEVATRARDRGIKLHALDALAQRADGPPVLHGLVARDSPTRLPWRIRRSARRALARAERTAR